MRKLLILLASVILISTVCFAGPTPPEETGTISGTVVLQPGSKPQISVLVQLLDPIYMSQIDFRVTDSNGYYEFTNLEPGTYYIRLVDPCYYTVITENPVYVPLGPGDDITVDFEIIYTGCCQETAEIQGTVYVEPLPNVMENVVVNLLDGSQQTPTQLQSTFTDESGFYSFPNLSAGTYYVQIEVPDGYTADQNDVPSVLLCGNVDVIDFVLTPPAPELAEIQGTVYEYFEPGSEPFEGAVVNLRSGFQGPILVTEVTNSYGFYDFPDLPAGTYYVDIVVPDGYILISPNNEMVVLPVGGLETVNFYLVELGEIEGTVYEYFGPGSDPFDGIIVNLLDGSSNPLNNTVTDANGFYQFPDLTPGGYIVQIEVPDGYTADQNNVPETLDPGETAVIDFVLEATLLVPGEIKGTITKTPCNVVVPGVTVNLLDGFSNSFDNTVTDANGFYDFPNLPPGNYIVQIVVPLGYIANQNNVPETLLSGEVAVIDFILTATCQNYAGYAGSIGFWKHQVNGNGKPQYTQTEMVEFAQDIFAAFYENGAYPIQVPDVTYNGSPPQALTLAEMQNLFNYNGNNMLKKAKKQYLAVLLNIVSGKLEQTDWVSYDHATASQGVVYVNQILYTDTEDAKDIAEGMNVGFTLPAGVIDLTIPYIIFGGGFEAQLSVLTFEFTAPYPNPFNPQTTLSFTMEKNDEVKLTVYDIRGREVANIVNGFLSSGTHSFIFDADNLSAGVYFARLMVGNKIQTQKLLLVK